MEDVQNFFDKYVELEESINKVVTTGDIVTAEIGFNEGDYIKINGVNSKNTAIAIKENDVVYLPLSEMLNIYNININYIEETNIITVDSIDRELKQATVGKNCIVREKKRNILSSALEKLSSGDKVYVVSDDTKGWTKVRTSNGKVGYVKTSILSDYTVVQEAYSFYGQSEIEGKVNMVWDYFSENSSAPDRTGETIEGVNVVSPTFFYIDKNGNLQENIGDSGEKYIEWAKAQGLQIWPRVANDLAGIDVTSKLLNDYSSRQQLISDLVNACMIYDFDGINIDFENMYKDDKDVFSRLIIEMVPIMKGSGGLTVSVDVTAPDGASTWSLCYDRNVLGDVADYVVFMAYDQYGSSSKTAGTTAGYNWVENNIKKFINNEEVSSEKIILGIPFYTRIWTETNDKVVSRTVDMNNVDSYIPSGVEKTWDDTLKQYYVEYTSDNSTKKMWIEDTESIKAKCALVKQYNLAGVAGWEKDREDSSVWDVIEETIN
jgi:spore germination protein YaaH